MLSLLLLTVVVGTASSFSPNYPLFLVGIFICGFSSLGYGTVMYVWMMEHVGGKYKTILGAAPHYNFGFWGLMTAVFAYALPHWRLGMNTLQNNEMIPYRKISFLITRPNIDL